MIHPSRMRLRVCAVGGDCWEGMDDAQHCNAACKLSGANKRYWDVRPGESLGEMMRRGGPGIVEDKNQT